MICVDGQRACLFECVRQVSSGLRISGARTDVRENRIVQLVLIDRGVGIESSYIPCTAFAANVWSDLIIPHVLGSANARHTNLACGGCAGPGAEREQSEDLGQCRDRFPSPYTTEDAESWVRHCARAMPATDFAIEVDGEAAGGIGVVLHDDVERVSAELGFWLGETFWGRGVMTDAVSPFVPWAFRAIRLDAHLRPRLRVQRRVCASAREGGIRARSAASSRRDQARARSSTNGSTRRFETI